MSTETEHTTLSAELAADYARLRDWYTLVNPVDVQLFLVEHPALLPVLLDLHPRFARVFPHAQLSLQILRSPAVQQATGHVLLQITTSLPAAEALELLDHIVRSELPATGPEVTQLLLIDVASNTEPESGPELAERYRQRFSTGQRAYHELARHFLFAPTDSDERALAGAEIEAALARASGQQLAERGGDPRAVLARLRREREARDDRSNGQ